MVHSYVRDITDGQIRRIFNFDGGHSLRETMIQFKKQHFTQAAQMLVPSNPKRATDVKDLNVSGRTL